MTDPSAQRGLFGTEPTAADAAIRFPKQLTTSATVGELRRLFEDEHVHAALLVEDGVLISVIQRSDLNNLMAHDTPVSGLGQLSGRIIDGQKSLESAYRLMIAAGQRRLAVIDPLGRLLGLLCLRRSRTGFCADGDVRERQRERLDRPEGRKPS